MLLLFKNPIPAKKNNRNLIRKRKWLISLPSKSYNHWHTFITKNIKDIVYNIDYSNKDLDLFKYTNAEQLKIKAIFFPNNYKRFDLTNIIQSVEDTLTDLKIIKDDSFKFLSSFEYFTDMDYTDTDIFLIVELTKLTDDEIIEKKNKFKYFYKVFKNNILENIPSFTPIININKSKKKKKEKVFFDPNNLIKK